MRAGAAYVVVVLGLCALVPAAVRADEAHVAITSDPAGAALAVDGEAVGVTPWSGSLPCGTHEASAASAGYVPARVHFELGPSGTSLSLMLVHTTDASTAHAGATPAHRRTPSHATHARSVLDVVGPIVLAAGGLSLVVVDLVALTMVGTSADGATRTSIDGMPFALNLVFAGIAVAAALIWWIMGDGRSGEAAASGMSGAGDLI